MDYHRDRLEGTRLDTTEVGSFKRPFQKTSRIVPIVT